MQVLKSWPQFFQPICDRLKLHDLRDARDRSFKVGEVVLLQEYDPVGGRYTGREKRCEITFITGRETPCALSSVALMKGFVILSLNPLDEA